MVKLDFGLYLYNLQNFIKKYPNYIKDIIGFSGKVLLDIHVLYVPKDIKIKEYINLQNLLLKKNLKKLVIILEKSSCIKIYETIKDKKINRDIFCILQEKACFDFLFLIDKQEKLNFTVSLSGEYAKANIKGFYFADQHQKINLQTSQKHLCKNTESNVVVNGVLTDGAHVNYRGNIFVDKCASGSRVVQRNKNIILECENKEKSEERKKSIVLDAMPQMEILNNDVSCTHGCAIGGLDEKQIFYLQSRGLSQKEAKKILIEGFFDFLINPLDNFDNSDIKESLVNKMRIKAGQLV